MLQEPIFPHDLAKNSELMIKYVWILRKVQYRFCSLCFVLLVIVISCVW